MVDFVWKYLHRQVIFLKKRVFPPTIGFSGELPLKFSFLPKPEKIATEISGARDFVLSFDTTRNKIIRLKTEEKEDKYNIYMLPLVKRKAT